MKDYRVLTQLLIAALAIVLLLVAMHSWRATFPYRIGHFVPYGVMSRVAFNVENSSQTQRAIADRVDASPLVFVQQNGALDRLVSTFRDQLSEIANADSAGDVSAAVANSFGWSPLDASARDAQFLQLRGLVTNSDASTGEEIDLMVLELSQLLGAARLVGILEPSALSALGNPGQEISRQQPIEIVNKSGDPIQFGILADVILEDQLRDTGRLGKEWVNLNTLKPIRSIVEGWLTRNLGGQLTYDVASTEEHRRLAKEAVEIRYDVYPAGAVIVPGGTRITPDQLQRLELEYAAHDAEMSVFSRLLRVLSMALMLGVLAWLFGVYLKRSEQKLLQDTAQLFWFAAICVVAVGLSSLLSHDPWRAEILPIMAAVMIVAIVYNQVLAILTALCLSLLVSTATVAELGHFVILITISVTAVVPLRRVSSRSTLIKVGFLVAVTGFVAGWGVNVIESHAAAGGWRDKLVLLEALKFAGWSLVCCYLVAGSLPFIESAFDIVTDISLLELTDVSHPLLQELARRAPGTYNHSMTVATIGEAAADAIGANGLLVRVGAYFHDIGKMLKPEYFIENKVEGQVSAHEKLSPAMSALIIIGHVKDGSEMAEQHNLPQKLIDFIEQHHGTTLVEYFFHEATIRADEDHRTDADESTFRYPGPRPQSREAGVMMLSDAVESASRSLSEPTPKRIQSLVREITLKRLLDGQFDDCGLKMSELRVVQESLVKTLLAVHHGRIKYPDQKSA